MEKLKTYAIVLTLAIASIIGFSAYGLLDNKSEKVTTQEWRRLRLGPGQFKWEAGLPQEGIPCVEDPDICHVVLPAGMNPATMTTSQIIANAVDNQYAFGYTTE